VTVCLSRERKVLTLLGRWWSVQLGMVVSWKNGSDGRLQVVERCLDVSGPPRLLMVCD